MPLVSEAELAQILKRHRKTIREAVAKGRLTQRPDKLFDRDEAVKEFAETTHHERGHNNMHGPVAAAEAADGAAPLPEIEAAEIPLPSETKSTAYAKARAGTQIYEALLKKLRYEERAKNLMPTAEVENARFTEFRILREACFNIPPRVAALIAGESDVTRCQQLLEAELTTVFSAFADGQLADGKL